MADYLVHTMKVDPEVHFFYRVTSKEKETAFSRLQNEGAIDWGERHVETFSLINDRYHHELVAIFTKGR